MKLVFKKTDNNNVFFINLVDDSSFENENINFEINLSTKIKKHSKSPRGSKSPKKKT